MFRDKSRTWLMGIVVVCLGSIYQIWHVKGESLQRQDEQTETLVIMSSYNGAAFIAEQLQSIVKQKYKHWSLLLRDDGSTDDTLSLFQEISKQDSRLKLLRDNKARLGAAQSFHALMRAAADSSSKYIVFSDQDDAWLPDKLSKQIALMKAMEVEYPGEPILIHSDIEVVDVDLNQLAASFMSYQGIDHEEKDPLRVLLVQNFVTGCTAVINRRLLETVLPMPESALMHDWWLALCAAVFGQVAYIDESLLKYRQHDNNEVGAKHLGDYLNPISGKWRKRWLEGRMNLFQSMKQAQALADRIREHDPDNPQLKLVEAYASLQGQSPLQRIKSIRSLGVHTQSNSRQALLFSRLLFTPQDKYV